MVRPIAVLFVRQDSPYKTQLGCDCYDIERDARTFAGGIPVIAHPPCRAWGVLKHLAKPRPDERDLALWAVKQVQKNGGILEHPAGTGLWRAAGLPEVGEFLDEHGGFTIEIDQYSFHHVAHKATKLYICGLRSMFDLLPIPTRDGKAEKSITGQVPGTKRCTQYEREYTPTMMMQWLIETARKTVKV